jgi:pimeloyl-ACP methyl ester carboxylesterase
LTGASIAVDVSGTKLSATTDSSGKYKCEFPLPPEVTQGTYTATATASYSGYPSASKSTSFVVGEIGMQLEENAATGNPYIGVAADGVSSLTFSISLPGCSDVKLRKVEHGEVKGDLGNPVVDVDLDSDGQADFFYFPPNYPLPYYLTQKLDVHQSGSDVYAIEVPIAFTYTDANGEEGMIETKISVCRPPVMLVHGFLGAPGTWTAMSDWLRDLKFDTFTGNYFIQGAYIEGLSAVLKSDIETMKLDYANADIKLLRVDAVGHSMGGLIARYYAHGLPDYPGDLRKLIMVGTPNHGSSLGDVMMGTVAADWYDTHTIPALQLKADSLFMNALNRGEKVGTHLNPLVQYGNIYGQLSDWVVTEDSAYLNGVAKYTVFDVKHSSVIPDIPGFRRDPITIHQDTWDRVFYWLTHDISRVPLKDMHATVHKYRGNVYLGTPKFSFKKVESAPTEFPRYVTLRTDKDSKAIVHLMLSDCTWGIIFLDQDSELTLGDFSPDLVQVHLLKGKAAFWSKDGTHFSAMVRPVWTRNLLLLQVRR